MRIDNVEKMWSSLEESFSKSPVDDRVTFARALVAFNGSKGAVAGLEASIKVDLDNDPNTITRYKALCTLLESAEDWLIKNVGTQIRDLDEWVLQLQGNQRLDMSKIDSQYRAAAGDEFLHAIQKGYVIPGYYGKMESVTFPTMMPGYCYIGSVADAMRIIPTLFESAIKGDNFSTQTLYLLRALASPDTPSSEYNGMCVFISEEMLKDDIQRFKKIKSVTENVPSPFKGISTISLNYVVGVINISVETNVPIYVIGRVK